MSGCSVPPVVVQQGNLFGGVSVVWIHGVHRTRMNRIDFATAEEAERAITDSIRFEKARRLAFSPTLPATSRCANCFKEGDTELEFGTRLLRGKRVVQSWCRKCRGKGFTSPRRRQARPS